MCVCVYACMRVCMYACMRVCVGSLKKNDSGKWDLGSDVGCGRLMQCMRSSLPALAGCGSTLPAAWPHLRGLVVPDVRVERRDEHERRLHQLPDPGAVRLDAGDARLGEASARVGEQARRGEQVGDHERLEDVELEVALCASHGDGDVVAHHLQRERAVSATWRAESLPT